ncbi:hypothetical protein D3C80_909950 [compost metagenome]
MQLQRQQRGEVACQLRRQHHAQIRRRHQVRRLQVVGRGVDDLPRQPLLPEPLIDHAARLPAMHPEVTQAQKRVEVQCAAHQRMLLAQGNLQGLAAPVMTGKTRRNLIEAPQHQVQLAPVQGIHRQARRQRGDVQAQVRRAVLQAAQQAWHAQLLDEVGHGDAKGLPAQARVEAFADVEGLLDLLQRRADRAFQGQGLGRRLHAPADAHQQRVVEQFAQARQGVAHRRLAEGQALGGA